MFSSHPWCFAFAPLLSRSCPVVVYRDGSHSGVAFGRGSVAFRSIIASQQSRLLNIERARQLLCCVALRGLEDSKSDVANKQAKTLLRQAFAATSSSVGMSTPSDVSAWRVRERPQPKLSFNFGAFPFVYLVPGVRALDSYLGAHLLSHWF